MEIKCQKCEGKVLLWDDESGKTVLRGRCSACGQGYYKQPPEDIEIK